MRRYVDDILIYTFTEGQTETVEDVTRSTAPEFKFTVEKPEDDVLQFLDLRIHVNRGLCWEYGKENSKPVLPRMGCHSETVKPGIVNSVVRNALERSWFHHTTESVERQSKRLISVG